MLYYKKIGEGDPLIILHGLFGSGDNWRTIGRKLSDDFMVILIDQANHSRSPWTDEWSYEQAAKDVIEVMDELELDSAHILGHSMGGKVTMTLAQMFPNRVERLIMVDIAPKAYPRGHDLIFEAIFAMNFEHINDRGDADEQLATKIGSPMVRQFLLKSLARDPEKGWRWKTNFQLLYDTYDKMVAEIPIDRIDQPSLFIRGGRSIYVSEEDIISLKANMSDVHFVTIDAGHWVHAERPQELLSAVRSFIG